MNIYRAKISQNWVLPLLLLLLGFLFLILKPNITSITIAGLLVFWSLTTLFLILKGTWLRIENGYLSSVLFLLYRKSAKIACITDIFWRGGFIFSKKRFPLLDIYVNKQFAFSINLKPFSKAQVVSLINNLIKINPHITLDKRLIQLTESIR